MSHNIWTGSWFGLVIIIHDDAPIRLFWIWNKKSFKNVKFPQKIVSGATVWFFSWLLSGFLLVNISITVSLWFYFSDFNSEIQNLSFALSESANKKTEFGVILRWVIRFGPGISDESHQWWEFSRKEEERKINYSFW